MQSTLTRKTFKVDFIYIIYSITGSMTLLFSGVAHLGLHESGLRCRQMMIFIADVSLQPIQGASKVLCGSNTMRSCRVAQ